MLDNTVTLHSTSVRYTRKRHSVKTGESQRASVHETMLGPLDNLFTTLLGIRKTRLDSALLILGTMKVEERLCFSFSILVHRTP